MKTAISLPDQLFHDADLLASKLNISRSQLYVSALEKYIESLNKSDLTERINDFIDKYGNGELDLKLNNHIFAQIKKDEW